MICRRCASLSTHKYLSITCFWLFLDMPCIASGSSLLYMDPSNSVFDQDPAAMYKFDQRSNRDLIKTHQDFASFSRLHPRFWKDGYTPGSLFKFTLRKEPSSFSTVCYDNDRFEKLMKKFLDEAFLTLIFLKNVKKLSFFVIEENVGMNEVYTINMKQLSGMKEKERFSNRIKEHVDKKNFKTTETLNHTLQLIQHYQQKKQTFTYAISEYFGFSGNNPDFIAMMKNDDLSYVPLVAVALPIRCADDVGGHIFAALPLPLQVKCMTGMPVHVNGFFALGQDRKDLTWRTLSECRISNDKTVNWNFCLITELLPVVYSNLMKYLIASYQQDGVTEVYKAWPSKTRVDKKWGIFLDQYYNIMYQAECIYSSTSRKWVAINKVHFIDEKRFDSQDQIKVISSLIKNVGLHVEMVDTNITGSYIPDKLKWVCHILVRHILKESQTYYQKLSMASQTKVLQFLVNQHSDWNELSAIKLFPFANGSYGSLNNTNANLILDEEIQMLLPSKERTLDRSIFRNANKLLATFKDWVNRGNTLQIKRYPYALQYLFVAS